MFSSHDVTRAEAALIQTIRCPFPRLTLKLADGNAITELTRTNVRGSMSLPCALSNQPRDGVHSMYPMYHTVTCGRAERQGKMQLVNIYSGGLSLCYFICKIPYNFFSHKKNS